MDDLRNPFAPNAGTPPPELAGRDAILAEAKTSVGRAMLGRDARALMLIGLRGTGKTVLLNRIA
jgi:Cdc6-like AAA superfamily ATPase